LSEVNTLRADALGWTVKAGFEGRTEKKERKESSQKER
jgi:hypothetical protein